jgi:hypothetical protein
MQHETNINRYYEHGDKAPKSKDHIVICVTLTDREIYYIDLTGAQFGQHDAVVLAAEYPNARVTKITETHPLGHQKKEVEKTVGNPLLASICLGGKEDVRLELIEHDAAARLYADLEAFLQGLGPMTLKDVLRAKKDDFDTMRESLIKVVGEGLKEFVEEAKGHPEKYSLQSWTQEGRSTELEPDGMD